MSDSHVIRLGEPWQCTAEAGSVRYQRSFHCPTGLTDETVWLVLEDAPAGASALLNGQPLAATVSQRGFVEFEITALLAPRNSIQIDVAADVVGPAAPTLGPVKLDIRSSQLGRS
ncbi:MAG: hypothetical protein OES79_09390 [Planctomycetota bacterium]|nr:hypothetical protein [Planctomycetota bacterium]